MPKEPKTEQEPDTIGKPHAGSERARDEERDDGGPRYGGGKWSVADERGDQRFGRARNDDADPSELTSGKGSVDDDEWPGNPSELEDASPETDATGEDEEVAKQTAADDDGQSENGGQRAGMGRGEKPAKSRAPNRSRR